MKLMVLLVPILASCGTPAPNVDTPEDTSPVLIRQESATKASLRGLSVVSDSTAWASGANGTYLRTTNGGESWETGTVPGADGLDFRDVEGTDAETAYLLSAGEPAKLFGTTDGGAQWRELYSNDTPGIFFDSMAFWDGNRGIAFSDPVEGSFVIIRTTDGGTTWEQVPPENLPPAHDGEAGFAASGTMVAVQGGTDAWIGTGGKTARVLRSTDQGSTWEAVETPMRQGGPSTGIFSITFWDPLNGVIVGGDYQDPDNQEANAARSIDGGRTWKSVEGSPPLGFRSAVAYVPHTDPPMLIAVGTSGMDISRDGGMTWTSLSTEGYHTVALSPSGRVGWATGSEGRMAKIQISMN
jgi:photosystem II stability/assembly factor-like uncharacterized protein